MQGCPNCGYRNSDEASTCVKCGKNLLRPELKGPQQQEAVSQPLLQPTPRPQPPTPIRSAARKSKFRWQINTALFLLGLGIWLGVLFVLLFTTYGRSGIVSSIFSSPYGWPIAILTPIILTIIPKTRFVGYGMLTGLLATPCIIAMSCSVLVSGIH